MVCEIKTILSFLSGLLTPVIAVVAIIIAIRQFKIQQYKVRIDLYDRRIIIYDAIMDFMIHVRQHVDASNDQIYEFIEKTSKSKFLFKGEIKEHIDKLIKKALDLQEVNKELSNHNLPKGDERTNFAKERTRLFKSLREQYNRTDELFLKYISLDK